MRRLASLAVIAAVAAGGFLSATPAQADCYVNVHRPVALGVCAAISRHPQYGTTCVHVAIYTDYAATQHPLVCV